jgi:hypothetical protein
MKNISLKIFQRRTCYTVSFKGKLPFVYISQAEGERRRWSVTCPPLEDF